MQLKVKKLVKEAVLPKYATDGSNGLDLVATAVLVHPSYVEVRTGISVEIPEGYVGLLFSRSSISNRNLMLANGTGVIDNDYRGEVILRFKALNEGAHMFKYASNYKAGDKVGQLVIIPLPKVEVIEIKEVKETARGSGSFGSTGN